MGASYSQWCCLPVVLLLLLPPPPRLCGLVLILIPFLPPCAGMRVT
jgi:hypothetical protein